MVLDFTSAGSSDMHAITFVSYSWRALYNECSGSEFSHHFAILSFNSSRD